MSTQPEALRLADAPNQEWGNDALNYDTALDAANELRRVHAANVDCLEHFNALKAERDELLEALRRADEFIDGVRQDLHHERIADWYPEGAHNSAEAMSESMRLIGNRCAEFDVASVAIAKSEA